MEFSRWAGADRRCTGRRYELASLLLAGLATPLVVSVHTVVSFDFAVAIVPGWHTTIFPPYFVAGAIYSGFAMVMTLAIPIRKFYNLEDMVTMRHLDNMAKVMLATGMIVAYGYMMETFMAFYSGNPYDRYLILNRMTGPYAVVYWSLIACNIVIPQAMWFRKVRDEHAGAVCDFADREHGHVARAVCDRGDQPEPRLHSFDLEHVLPDEVGLDDVHRDVWTVLYAVLALRALPPDDFDRGDAFAGAGDGREIRRNSGNSTEAMAQIFHHSTNLISRLSIYGGVFILGAAGSGAV